MQEWMIAMLALSIMLIVRKPSSERKSREICRILSEAGRHLLRDAIQEGLFKLWAGRADSEGHRRECVYQMLSAGALLEGEPAADVYLGRGTDPCCGRRRSSEASVCKDSVDECVRTFYPVL